MRKATAIINPAAANGKAAKVWQHYKSTLKAHNVLCSESMTEASGHGIALTKQALMQGHELILAVGGDGTLNEVVNGFFDNGILINPDASLGIVPKGTGTDFVRALNVPRSPEALAETLRKWRTHKIDVGRLTCQSFDGQPITRYFINVADIGYGGALMQRYGKLNRIFPGPPAYFLGLLANLLSYRNPRVNIRIDGGKAQTGVYNAIIVANAQYFGGGMWIAPNAKLDDGLFEFVLVGDINKLEVVANLRRIYNGTLSKHPKVTTLIGKKLEALSDETVLLETDGELPGKLPATFEILPGMVRVVVE